ncbi:hypothetical protein VTL71DRAFT_11159 [Oculimacula yallundae]|uniref:Arsenite methyltransferase n=1 Tax=Oculimacula yallundae TaxID=86028 RepID=A0ABR4CV70_9HELO
MVDSTIKAVHDHYSSIARSNLSANTSHAQEVASSFGYSASELADSPSESNLGLSCGNPFAIAGIKEGETVIDLGSGGGFDIFQASRKVGPSGYALGVDSSADMISLALRNKEKGGNAYANVQFILSDITAIPLESHSADCIISNCVINLLEQEKKRVCFAECFRLLKEGGRLAVSDILAKKTIPEELRKDLGLYVGCVSGASLVKEYEGWLREAGFEGILIVDKKTDLNIYKERAPASESNTAGEDTKDVGSVCCAPAVACCGTNPPDNDKVGSEEALAERVADIDFNEWVSSYSIYAVKLEIGSEK